MDFIASDAEERTFGEFRRKKATHKKASTKSRSRKPVDLQAIRETIANLVGVEAVEICSALAEEARKGELAPAKFRFEMSGLYPVSAVAAGEDEEVDADGEDGEDLAKVLLQRLKLPVELPEDGELAAANVPVGDSVE
jgi:hypothetical protein